MNELEKLLEEMEKNICDKIAFRDRMQDEYDKARDNALNAETEVTALTKEIAKTKQKLTKLQEQEISCSKPGIKTLIVRIATDNQQVVDGIIGDI